MTTAVVVDPAVASTYWRTGTTSRNQIWFSTTVVYEFYSGPSHDFGYSKSSDAGATWDVYVTLVPGTAGIVDSDIYYARWHNTANNPIVHVVGHDDSGTRGLYYNNIDLSTDTKQTANGTLILSIGAQPDNKSAAIGMARNGDVIVACSEGILKSTNGGTSFTTIGDHADLAKDHSSYIWPDASSADTADWLLFRREDNDNLLYVTPYDDSAGAFASSVLVSSNLVGTNPTAQGGRPTYTTAYNRSDSGAVLVAGISPSDGSGDPNDIFTVRVLGSASITAKTNVLTDTSGVATVALQVNANGTIYCAYVRDDLVYYKSSSDGMVTWGTQTAYSTLTAHTMEQLHADPSPNVNLFMPAYLHSVSNPLASDLNVEVPAVGATTVNLTGSLPLVFTLTGTLTGVTASTPIVVIKCQAVVVPGTIQLTAVVR